MKRIQCKRENVGQLPGSVSYVGKGTKWENSYEVVCRNDAWYVKAGEHFVDAKDKADAEHISQRLYEIFTRVEIDAGALDLFELIGKDIACCCPLDKKCHADVLIKLCNEFCERVQSHIEQDLLGQKRVLFNFST